MTTTPLALLVLGAVLSPSEPAPGAPDPEAAFAALSPLPGVQLRRDDEGRIAWLEAWGEAHADVVLAHLRDLPDLEVLQMMVPVRDARVLAEVGQLERLKELWIDWQGEEPNAFAPLAALSELQRFVLCAGSAVTDEHLAALARLARLEELDLSGVAITDDGLAHLAGLSNLRSLDLSDTDVKGPGLRHLRDFTLLSTLDLSKTGVGGGALAELAPLSNLRELLLDDCEWLRDDDLLRIPPLRSLERLSLGGAVLEGRGLSGLKRLTRLKHLGLRGIELRSEAVAPLVALRTLETLNVDAASFTADECRALLSANPRLTSFGLPSDLGAGIWEQLDREFPRFSVQGWGCGGRPNLIALVHARREKADATTPLMDAVVRRDLERIQELLHGGVDPDERAPCERVPWSARTRDESVGGFPLVTPLHAACAGGDREAVEVLLAHGADPRLGLVDGRTPLVAAAEIGDEAIVRRLLCEGAPIDDGSGAATSVIVTAIEHDHFHVAGALRRAGGRVARGDAEAGLLRALWASRLEHVRWLLEDGVRLDGADPEVQSAALDAALADPRPLPLELVLLAGAPVERLDDHGTTPLHRAAAKGRTPHVRTLLEYGADRDVRSRTGWTAAMFAIRGGFPELAATLRTPSTTTADVLQAELFLALERGDEAAVARALDAGVDPDARGPGAPVDGGHEGGVPVLLALEHGATMVRHLVDAGADLSFRDDDGWGVLEFAIVRQDVESFDVLVEAGMPVDRERLWAFADDVLWEDDLEPWRARFGPEATGPR